MLILLGSVAHAQDSLIGTWELQQEDEQGSYLTRLVLVDGGVARISMIGHLSGQSPLPDPTTLSLNGTGTWAAADGQLVLDVTRRELRINGASFAVALDTLAQLLAQSLAVELEVPQDGIADLTVTVRAALGEELDEEELVADLISLLQGGIAYTLTGDRLLLDDGAGGVESWIRVASTAVGATSWGRIKDRTHRERSWTN